MTDKMITTDIPHWLQPPKLMRTGDYPEWVFEEVLRRLASGMFLSNICKDPTMPKYDHLLQWIHSDLGRKERYYQAKEVAAEVESDKMLMIADGDDDNGIPNDVQRDSLRVHTRKWLVGVWNRKRFGDTKQVDVDVKISLVDAMEEAREREQSRRQPLTINQEDVT